MSVSLGDSIVSRVVILMLFHDLVQLIKDFLKIGTLMPILVHAGLRQILHLQQVGSQIHSCSVWPFRISGQ